MRTRRARYGSAWNAEAVARTKLAKHGDAGWNNPAKGFETKRRRGTMNESWQEKVVAEAVRTAAP